ncbi:MAG: DUF3288 family protein [Cyanobacteria bacterium P01_E01_bin.48]
MADQKHPQHSSDRALLSQIMGDGSMSDFNLAEVARLRIRYEGFPGARDIQADLDAMLERWQLSEGELMARARSIHQTQTVYRERFSNRDDWA